MKEEHGEDIFERGAFNAVSKFCQELGIHHVSKTVTCTDNKGQYVKRTMAKIASFDQFVQAAGIAGKDGEEPEYVVAADGSTDKLIICLWNGDEENSEVFLLAMIDKCHENRHNLKLMLQSLGFPLKYKGKSTFLSYSIQHLFSIYLASI